MAEDLSPYLRQSRKNKTRGRPLTECIWKSPSIYKTSIIHVEGHIFTWPRPFAENPMQIFLNRLLPSVASKLEHPLHTTHSPERPSLEGPPSHANCWTVISGSPAPRLCHPCAASPHTGERFDSLCSTAILKSYLPSSLGLPHWAVPGGWLISHRLSENKSPCSIVPQGCMISLSDIIFSSAWLVISSLSLISHLKIIQLPLTNLKWSCLL